MKVLYAEDERALSSAVSEILRMEGFEVVCAYDGLEALEFLKNDHFDVCVFDIMMPKMSGLELLKEMRSMENYTPVLMLTAKTTTEDKIDGLSSGADDYLCKPFDVKELMARLKSMIRRSSPEYKNKNLVFENMQLNCTTNEVKAKNGSLMLSSKESEILSAMMKNPDAVFSIDDLNEYVQEKQSKNNAVKLYVSYLQHKLVQIGARAVIEVSREGYYLARRL